jgi:hypothetical protein
MLFSMPHRSPTFDGMRKRTAAVKSNDLGRPEKSIDLQELEKLCALQCTQVDLACWFDVSLSTIERRQRDSEFAAVMARGYARGRVSLRRKQMQLAEQGNPAMLIWLGKQYLGQRDTVDQTIGAPGGGPAKIEIVRVTARTEIGTDEPAERPGSRLNQARFA